MRPIFEKLTVREFVMVQGLLEQRTANQTTKIFIVISGSSCTVHTANYSLKIGSP